MSMSFPTSLGRSIRTEIDSLPTQRSQHSLKRMDSPVPEDFMEEQDTDGDGQLSWNEFTGPKVPEPPVADAEETDPDEIPLFAQIDMNGDAFLDKAEVEEFFGTIGQDVPEDLWGHEDMNKDGRISWNEFTGPKGTVPPSAREEL